MPINEQTEAAEYFTVGMADLTVSQDHNTILCTFPLGACLGVAVYDPVMKVGGVLHSMLPDSSIDPNRATARPGMFLDTGLALLLKHAGNLKSKKENLLVYAAGGSQIMDDTAGFNIGKRNYEVFTELLAQNGLTLQAADVGGLTNRSLQLNLGSGEVRLRFSGQAKMKVLCKS
jgi:chemotaxis protein CheD